MYKEYARLRDERNITDYKVAKDTGVSTATLSNWKSGAYTPKVDKLLILAEYFGVPLEDLVEKKKGHRMNEAFRNRGDDLNERFKYASLLYLIALILSLAVLLFAK